MSTVPSNPNDIRECVELILSVALIDVSGTQRDDLDWCLTQARLFRAQMEDRDREESHEIQDSRLLEALQSWSITTEFPLIPCRGLRNLKTPTYLLD